WALDRAGIRYDEDGHLPILHWIATRRARAGRTVPVLVADGRVFPDSTDIVAWAEAQRPGTFGLTADALELEDHFDRPFGPATRRWGYNELLPRRDLDHMIDRGVPRWQARAFKLGRPLASAMLRRGLTITPDGVERSRHKIAESFARVEALLADGRRYLTG